MKNSIKERARKVPLKTKLTVFFWLEWIRFNIPKERNHTEEENKKAWKYAKEKTSELINILNKAPGEIQSVMDNKDKNKFCTCNYPKNDDNGRCLGCKKIYKGWV